MKKIQLTENKLITIGDRVRYIREYFEKSRKEFSSMIDIDPSTLGKIERNDEKTGLSKSRQEEIISLFNVNYEWLVNGEGEIFKNKSKKDHPKLYTLYTENTFDENVNIVEDHLVEFLRSSEDDTDTSLLKKIEFIIKLSDMRDKLRITEEDYSRLVELIMKTIKTKT